MEDFIIIFASYLVILKIVFYLTSLFICISSLDDFFIDICYFSRRFWRNRFIYNKHSRLNEMDLFSKKEQKFALMVPAWHEQNVIEKMLLNCLKTYQYDKYVIFIGSYQNDDKTLKILQRLASNYPQIKLSICPHDGPTNKADCLNWIFKSIQKYETEKGLKFDGFILHDAEDIVHPLELKLYNYLIPRKDMVQIPVIPLKRSHSYLTAGHYQDEFAESHTKDLVVREFLTGHVPCAGVGCVFSRKAIYALLEDNIKQKNTSEVFNSSNLTEDYEMALKLNNLEMQQVFVRTKISAKNDQISNIENIIATREFFPTKFKDAVRQKSRWIIGIVFQGWQNQKWQGSIGLKYMLLRDRKSLFTAFFSMAAYFLFLNYTLFYGLPYIFSGFVVLKNIPPLFRSGDFISYILWANLFFLGIRAFNRALFCYPLYGLASALMSFPRLLWGNVINFCASTRAARLFLIHMITGKALVWEKTDHSFPGMEELAPFHRHIGEILKEHGIIDHFQLDRALKSQKQLKSYLLIGAILQNDQIITPDELSHALKIQTSDKEKNV
jgi:adsorption protein B